MNLFPWHCPLCDGKQMTKQFVGFDAMQISNQPYTVVQCNYCGLYSLYPRPQRHEILSLYPMDYRPFWQALEDEPNLFMQWLRRKDWQVRCHPILQTHSTGGRLLDVGCATGHFIRELERNPCWRAMGVDINPKALAISQRQKTTTFLGDLLEPCLSTALFDVITMWEVVEHVYDPVKMLLEIRCLLKQNGTLFLSTPNGNSFQSSLAHKYWAGWDVPRHLQIFTETTIQELFYRTGFKIIRKWTFPSERFFAMQTAHRWLEFYLGMKLNSNLRRLVTLTGFLLWPIFRLIDHSSVSSSLVIEAKLV